MWNHTDQPLAVLITFRCYGTWLHGDERGSIDRHNNKYGDPKYPPTAHWNQISSDRLKHAPVKLDAQRRKAVEDAIRETCERRGWTLLAISVRTNHLHVVVMIGSKEPELVLIALKANATRQMRENGCWPHEHSPWSEKGSKRRLWNDRSVANAVDYVINGQGDDLPDFDY
ncbi:MAG: transposase [Pyrinomonadaceae bacterium]|nr:transposase [Chloracidobacterium sp.]